jgi:3-oxoacyl-[acyl-carrier protein] reductase
MNLKGIRALVTGSSRGLGRSIALELAHNGADIAVNYSRTEFKAKEVAKEVEDLGSHAFSIKADVSKEDEVIDMVDAVCEEFGGIDILVNNAGFSSKNLWFAEFEDISEDMWYDVLDVDLKGTFLCSREVSKKMLTQKQGKIINISSTPAIGGDKYGILYSTAKAGILGLTKALAWSLAPNIQVNAIALGSIKTSWIEWLNKDDIQSLINETALKRFGNPNEIGRVVSFLASSESSFMTGQTMIVDGGAVMR